MVVSGDIEGGSARHKIETARLRLRQFAPTDFEELLALRSDPDVMRFIGSGGPHDEGQVRASLDKHLRRWEEHGFGMWAVEFKDEGALVGWCGLVYLEDGEEVEVGYGFSKAHWGKGLATEAARASLRYGFETLGLERIVAVAQPENVASRRVMEKIGMKYVRKDFFYGTDVVYYCITRSEFQPDNSPYSVTRKS